MVTPASGGAAVTATQQAPDLALPDRRGQGRAAPAGHVRHRAGQVSWRQPFHEQESQQRPQRGHQQACPPWRAATAARQHETGDIPAGQAGDSACAGRYDKKEPRDATPPPPDKERSTFRHGRSRRIPGRTGQPPMPPRQQQPDTTAETRHNTISNQARAHPESSRQTGRSAGAVHRSAPHPRRIAAHLRITSGDPDPDSG